MNLFYAYFSTLPTLYFTTQYTEHSQQFIIDKCSYPTYLLYVNFNINTDVPKDVRKILVKTPTVSVSEQLEHFFQNYLPPVFIVKLSSTLAFDRIQGLLFTHVKKINKMKMKNSNDILLEIYLNKIKWLPKKNSDLDSEFSKKYQEYHLEKYKEYLLKYKYEYAPMDNNRKYSL